MVCAATISTRNHQLLLIGSVLESPPKNPTFWLFDVEDVDIKCAMPKIADKGTRAHAAAKGHKRVFSAFPTEHIKPAEDVCLLTNNSLFKEAAAAAAAAAQQSNP